MLQVYNSLTRSKQEFIPLVKNKVNMYVCGVTVYDYCHLGHARTYVAFDVINRYLQWNGYDVNYVRNITDIDDKIIKRANENKEDFQEVVTRFTQAMHEDFAALGLLKPAAEPRATEYIPQIIALIQELIAKEAAYVASNGDVYFEVRKFPEYGCLAHRNIDQLESGARVEINDVKRDPLDFVLWKLAKPEEPKWSSPWGEGRPGWHIECSAMSLSMFNDTFDIHGGGKDLIFPHHENEIAQSEAATGKKFVNTWMHAGFLQIDKEKMSKSLGNFFTIRDLLAQHEPEVLRYFLITSHYRSPLQYSEDAIHQARNALERFYTALRDLPVSTAPKGSEYENKFREAMNDDFNTPVVIDSLYNALRDMPVSIAPKNSEYEKKFREAMNDDFNTPVALSVLFELAHEIQRLRDKDALSAAAHAALLRELGGVLGILQEDAEVFLKAGIKNLGIDAEQIENLIAARNAARAAKNWKEADRIRDELAAMSVTIEDGPTGTTWRV